MVLIPNACIYYRYLNQLTLTNPCDVMFARYLPSNYRVTLKLGVGSLKVTESATIQ